NILNNKFFNNGTVGGCVRTANFQRCRVIGNTMNGVVGNSISIAGGNDSICSKNIIENSIKDIYTDQSDNRGAIAIWGSRNIVSENHIDSSSYHGIWCSSSTGTANDNIISNNHVYNIGRLIGWEGTDFAGIKIQYGENNIVVGNFIGDSQEIPSTKRGIQLVGTTTINNSVYGNKISDNIESKTVISNYTRQTLVENNGGSPDPLMNGAVVTVLPTANINTWGKVYKIEGGSGTVDKFYINKKKSDDTFEFVEIFSTVP